MIIFVQFYFSWTKYLYVYREPQILKLSLKNVFASVGQRPAANAVK
jgi:hypothetical protein